MSVEVLIHLGYPKTASSTLQHGVLRKLEAEGNLHLYTWRKTSDTEPLEDRPSSRMFNGLPLLGRYLDFKTDRLNVLSDESFTVPIKLRRLNFGRDLVDPRSFPYELCNQIRERFGDNAKIRCLLVLRNQADLLYSQFVEEYNWKRYLNIDILRRDDGSLDLNGFEIYNYEEYIKSLHELFGWGNVTVLMFEDLRSSKPRFLKELSLALGCSTMTLETLFSEYHLNAKLLGKNGYVTQDGHREVEFFANDEKEQIRTFFADSNLGLRSLLEHTGGLVEYGYVSQ